MSEIHRDEFYVAVADGGIVRLERTPVHFPTMPAMHASYLALAAALRKAGGARRVLIDLRKGPPGRNDATFESEMAPWRAQLDKQCERVAVLVRTVAGKLQTQRLSRAEHREAHVYLNEAEALAFLLAP